MFAGRLQNEWPVLACRRVTSMERDKSSLIKTAHAVYQEGDKSSATVTYTVCR